jgi:hypothetical protein
MQVFYRVHVVGAALFVGFGIVHSRKVFVFFGPGLVLYGIDAAYRWLQACYDVTLHVNPGSSLVAMVIPLEVIDSVQTFELSAKLYHSDVFSTVCVPVHQMQYELFQSK